MLPTRRKQEAHSDHSEELPVLLWGCEQTQTYSPGLLLAHRVPGPERASEAWEGSRVG